MDCPNGHGPMMPGRKFWICEECGYRTEFSALSAPPKVSSAELAPLERLPSPVAIPWHEYSVEENPVLRLDRLYDATEISVRFLAVVALGEACRSLGDGPLPDDLLSGIQKDIERPTFGRWWRVLRVISEWLPAPPVLLVPEVPAFVRETLAPMLNGKDSQSSLIELRNERAHGGGLSRATAVRLLDEWKPRVDSLLAEFAFLSSADLRFTSGDQSYSLTGHAPILPANAGAAGRVSLHRGDESPDLWPLADYGHLPEVGRHDDVDRARELLVKIALSRNDFSSAMRLTGAIQGSRIKVSCLCLIAVQQHKAENDEVACQAFDAAYLAACDADYPSQFDWTRLVQGLTQAKGWDEAVDIIRQIVKGDEESSKCEQVKMLGIVSYSNALNGDFQRADNACNEALKLASTIIGDYGFCDALSHLLRLQVRAGRIDAARSALGVLLEQENQYRLFFAALAQVQLGSIQDAFQSLAKITGNTQRSSIMAAIAKQLASANRGADAVQVASQIITDKSDYLPEIAAILADRQDQNNFVKLLPLCCDTIETATRITSHLMLFYPEQAVNVGEHIINVLLTNVGLDLPPLPDEKIFIASTEGQFVDVKEMLARNPSLATARDPDGWTALHWAARQGQKQAVQILLRHCADINAVQENSGEPDTEDERQQKEKDGRTPLHSAVYGGHLEIVRLLLEQGANQSLTDVHGRRPQDVTENLAIKQLLAEDGREKHNDH